MQQAAPGRAVAHQVPAHGGGRQQLRHGLPALQPRQHLPRIDGAVRPRQHVERPGRHQGALLRAAGGPAAGGDGQHAGMAAQGRQRLQQRAIGLGKQHDACTVLIAIVPPGYSYLSLLQGRHQQGATASRRLLHHFQPHLERHMPAITRARVAYLRSPIPQPFDLAQACAGGPQ